MVVTKLTGDITFNHDKQKKRSYIAHKNVSDKGFVSCFILSASFATSGYLVSLLITKALSDPSQVINLYHPLALRLFLIGTHYRSPINYSNALLETASDRLYYIFQVLHCSLLSRTDCTEFLPNCSYWLQTLHDCEEILRQNGGSDFGESAPKDTLDAIFRFRSEFENSLSDDLHTPVALAALSEPLRIINDLLHTHKVWLKTSSYLWRIRAAMSYSPDIVIALISSKQDLFPANQYHKIGLYLSLVGLTLGSFNYNVLFHFFYKNSAGLRRSGFVIPLVWGSSSLLS